MDPEFQKTAVKLKTSHPEIKFGKIEGTDERKLTEKFEIKGFFKFFKCFF